MVVKQVSSLGFMKKRDADGNVILNKKGKNKGKPKLIMSPAKQKELYKACI